MKIPCKECGDRYPACHDECENYKSWKADYDALKEKIIKHRLNEKRLDERRNEAIKRMYRGKKK